MAPPDSSPDHSIDPLRAETASFECIVDIRFAASTTPRIEGSSCIPSGDLLASPSIYIPDLLTPTLVVCDIGLRSANATRALRNAGYANVVSLSGGMEAWFDADLPVYQPGHLTSGQYRRYDRQIKLPGVGVHGQSALGAASVAIVGVGGLGAPVLSCLAGSGVGHITIIDPGDVELSNLHRQTIYTTAGVGSPKVEQAAAFVAELNPEIEVSPVHLILDESNAQDLLRNHDVIVVCTDSFETAHTINSASVGLGIPMVFGSVYRTEGQLGVFDPRIGGCYACVFPVHAIPGNLDCSIVGVLGAVTGVVGSMQAAEVVKLLTGTGEPTVGILHLYDAADQTLTRLVVRRNPDCEVCS